ncbi:MAG: hypothetical protein EOO85_25770 [Pedobacter sp.]|nr:MAG: hypothetical protein EOO85_25770 [Pedobacter sp.]
MIPCDLSKNVKDLLRSDLTPEKAMKEFLLSDNEELYENIDLCLSPPVKNNFDDRVEYDIQNDHCCNPNCKHDQAHNKVLVKTNKKLYCVTCNNTNYYHPSIDGSIIPDNIYPSVSNLTLVNNGTINNTTKI